MQDIADRDRCLNLHFVCVKERSKNGKPRKLVKTIISIALGIDLFETELQRAHRSLALPSNEGQRMASVSPLIQYPHVGRRLYL